MRWSRRAVQPGAPPDGVLPGAGDADATDGDPEGEEEVAFVCSTCGRTDLPPAGNWDPPICLECDAEINFAAIEEVEITQDW